MLTGQMRFRESMFGKAVLQVEETGVADSNLWRDATIQEANMAMKQSSIKAKGIDPMRDWVEVCQKCNTSMRITKKCSGWFCPKCNTVIPI